jgi:hypothetical protein
VQPEGLGILITINHLKPFIHQPIRLQCKNSVDNILFGFGRENGGTENGKITSKLGSRNNFPHETQ